MTAPTRFIEASLATPGETLAAFIALDQIAVVREASQYSGSTKTLISLKSAEILQLSTEFATFVERMAGTGKDTE